MDLYLLENQVTSIPLLTCDEGPIHGIGSVEFHLQDPNRNSSNERGVVQGNHFPWKVHCFEGNRISKKKNQRSKKDDGNRGFKIRLEYDITVDSCKRSAEFNTEVEGDFVEILKYVYSTDSLPKFLKLSFQAIIVFPGSDRNLPLYFEMSCATTEVEFYNYSKLSFGFAEEIIATKNIHLEALTMQLVGENVDTSWMRKMLSIFTAPFDSSGNFTQQLNEKILKAEVSSDFVLVANNGFEMRSHKIFLAAQSPVFQRMFQECAVGNTSDRCQLSLSEESLKAFLGFVYLSKLDVQKLNATVAIELLQLSREKEMPALGEMVKDLLWELPYSWYDFDSILKLFVFCYKLRGYEALKIKIAMATKYKRDEIDKSIAFKELLETDRDGAFQLIKSALCSEKTWIVDNLRLAKPVEEELYLD